MSEFSARLDQPERVREIAEAHGFCLIKQVLEPSDLEHLLAGMKSYTAAAQHHDILSWEPLRWLLSDQRILRLARLLLGETLVYYGMGNVNYEETAGALTERPFNVLHVDAMGRPDTLGAVASAAPGDLYPAYRFGIYFRDYSCASGGLKVAPGSHIAAPAAYLPANLLKNQATDHHVGDNILTYQETRQPLFNVPSQPGDIVVWNLRTYHAAGAKMFKHDPSIALHPAVENAILKSSPELFAPNVGPRNALFFDYGKPAQGIDMYIKHYAVKQGAAAGAIEKWPQWPLDDKAAHRALSEHNIEIRYDLLMVPLALRLLSTYEALEEKTHSDVERAALQEEAEVYTRRLGAILDRYRDYSPYFSLFSRTDYTAAQINPADAVRQAAADILLSVFEHRKTSGYGEA